MMARLELSVLAEKPSELYDLSFFRYGENCGNIFEFLLSLVLPSLSLIHVLGSVIPLVTSCQRFFSYSTIALFLQCIVLLLPQ